MLVIMSNRAINLFRLPTEKRKRLKAEFSSFYGDRKIIVDRATNCHIWQVRQLTKEQREKRNLKKKNTRSTATATEVKSNKSEEKKARRKKYPQYTVKGVGKLGVHVVSYFLAHKQVAFRPDVISHRCHQPACANPSHLNLEPQSVNLARRECKEERCCLGHVGQPDCVKGRPTDGCCCLFHVVFFRFAFLFEAESNSIPFLYLDLGGLTSLLFFASCISKFCFLA